jgi:hypothetical protein
MSCEKQVVTAVSLLEKGLCEIEIARGIPKPSMASVTL